MSGVPTQVWIDRGNTTFEMYFSYYIPAYNDPETGETFWDISWTFSFYDVGGQWGGGGGGFSGESGFEALSIGFPAGEAVGEYQISFTAQNTFSGESVDGYWHVLNAGLATQPLALTGGADIDIIVSGSGNDTLSGAEQADVLDAGGGNDQLDGGDGDDWLEGGDGDDTMTGGAGHDSYNVDSARDQVAEGADGGWDTVYATISHRLAPHVEGLALYGVARNGTGNVLGNTITGNGAANTINGLGGDDWLEGYQGDDTLIGGGGNDTMDGWSGIDEMRGGLGDDVYGVDEAADRIVEAAGGGWDVVNTAGLASYVLSENLEALVNLGGTPVFTGTGNAGGNILLGGYTVDRLAGQGGDDTLWGDTGADLLNGGLGADSLVGGEGVDTASYADAASGVTVNLGLGLGVRGEARGDVLVDIENLVGSDHADLLVGDGGANRLDGGGGDDTLRGGGGHDWLHGGAGADLLIGGAGRDGASYALSAQAISLDLASGAVAGGDAAGDVLIGLSHAMGGEAGDTLLGNAAGNLLAGRGGGDVIDGRGGDDTVRGGTGADTMTGGDGVDVLSYAGSRPVDANLATGVVTGADAVGDVFSGFEGLAGSAGDDTLAGDSGDNLLLGDAGADSIAGGAGNDVVLGGPGWDTIDGGDGHDVLSFAGSTDWVSIYMASGLAISANGDRDSFTGIEAVRGSEVGDGLYGSDNDDAIHGGGGGDYIFAGGGRDVVRGGTGDDVFYFTTTSGVDRILDFTPGAGEDRIQLDVGPLYSTFDAVIAAGHMAGGSAVFNFAPGLQLVLVGVDLATLAADDFVFAA